MSQAFIIPAELLARIGAYLAERPHREVAQFFKDVDAQVKPFEPPPEYPE